MKTTTPVRQQIIKAARKLRDEVDKLTFGSPITHVYNPLRYAWKSHQAYLSRANENGIRVLFLGMNPGPWGMAQTGVPFGEVAAVRDWIGIREKIDRPKIEHAKRPIEGFECTRSEVSGRRLWGLLEEKFETSERFFEQHFVANFCPLVFMESSGRNHTPDKLPVVERERLNAACDQHLVSILSALRPEFAVGVGAYAEVCLKRASNGDCGGATVTRILHPSPASPAANKGWASKAQTQLSEAGVW